MLVSMLSFCCSHIEIALEKIDVDRPGRPATSSSPGFFLEPSSVSADALLCLPLIQRNSPSPASTTASSSGTDIRYHAADVLGLPDHCLPLSLSLEERWARAGSSQSSGSGSAQPRRYTTLVGIGPRIRLVALYRRAPRSAFVASETISGTSLVVGRTAAKS
jgi:hypothetical protein